MADYNSKYSGEQVEALLDQVASGNAGGGGGGGIAVETDPIFSASPAATITEDDILGWRNLGNDFSLLDGDVAELTHKVEDKQDVISDLDNIRSGAAKGATAVQSEDIADFVTAEDLASVATSGSYNDLSDKPTFKTINNESILGSGDITISGGSGQQGPQGDKGDKGDKGDTGVGVQSVTQTTTSNADGGSNVVTVTLTNGTKSTFTVKNGSKGSSGSNGTNGKDGADGATFTPSVDSAGNLSWSNNKGLTNPPTVNIKGPKGDAGEGGGSGGGKEIIVSNGQSIYFDETSPMQANTTYIYSGSLFVSTIQAFEVASNYDEYHIIFRWPESGFAIPDDVKFANGEQPNIEYDTVCELHIVGVTMGETRVYNAVLTPFK